MKQPDACIVRITDAQGETQGTGFLVSTDGLIATCAHVKVRPQGAHLHPAPVVGPTAPGSSLPGPVVAQTRVRLA